MLLKCDLMDDRGTVIEQLIFSELTVLNQLPESEQQDSYQHYQSVDLDRGRHQQTDNVWEAEHLPEGFMLTRSSTKPGSSGQGQVHQMVYSDGMASVSVFVEKQKSPSQVLHGVSNMGAVNAFATPVNGHQVTVIGEVPPDTVRLIGQSMRYTQ